MLKQRIVTALMLLPPVLAAVWFLPTAWLVLVIAVAALVAAQEWSVLAACDTPVRQGAFLAATAASTLALWWFRATPLLELALLGALFWWLWMIRWVLVYPRGFEPGDPPPWLRVAAGLLVIPAAILSIAELHAAEHGALRLFFLLFLVWAADVGAYFAGRAVGRRKLAPNVSPGKTWEGVGGGLLLAGLIIFIGGQWLFRVQGMDWLWLVLLCEAVVLLSIVGDLSESLLKRQAGVKDSGSMLPGHGGVLDRVDSLIAAAPAFVIGLWGLGL